MYRMGNRIMRGFLHRSARRRRRQGRWTALLSVIGGTLAFMALPCGGAADSGQGSLPVHRGDYKPPTKGPLVGTLKEDVDPNVPGPETTIRIYEDARGNQVREFTHQGATYQIQVIPKAGNAYYLYDNDGDGLFETRHHGYQPRLVVPQWVLFRF